MFSDLHRVFLQALFPAQVLSEEQAVDLLVGFTPFEPLELSTFVTELNKELAVLDLEIKRHIDENPNGQLYLILINTHDELFAQIATTFKPKELTFFKSLIDVMFNQNKESGFNISSMEALNLSSSDFGSKQEVQAFLDKLVETYWLDLSVTGFYSLGIRSLAELQAYLKDQYEDNVSICHLCLEILTKGESCKACKVSVHHYCLKLYFSQVMVQQSQRPSSFNDQKCPSCKKPWSRAIIDESFLPALGGILANTNIQQNRVLTTVNTPPVQVEESSDEDMFDTSLPLLISSSSSVTNTSKIESLRSKRRLISSDDDDDDDDD